MNERGAARPGLETPGPRSAYARRVRGCLLGGALGDALGAAIEFESLDEIRERHGPDGLQGLAPAYGRRGAITDDTQMTMFTAEGLIRAFVRSKSRGSGHPAAVVHHAYRRWLHTQGVAWRNAAQQRFGRDGAEPDGWLIQERFLHSRRAPGNTCLAALSAKVALGQPAENDSKGCGGVMRVAPVGLLPHSGNAGDATTLEGAFRLGEEIAALTHGHPTGQLASGFLAATIHALVHGDRPLEPALDAATRILRRQPRHDETLAAVEEARELAAAGSPGPARIEALGAGWVAEEALAIAVYSALVHRESVRAALLLAVNHSGDSDSTGAICGNLLGALHGEAALPQDWLAELEGRATLERLADDFVAEMTDTRPRERAVVDAPAADGTPVGDPNPGGNGFAAWWARYPGW